MALALAEVAGRLEHIQSVLERFQHVSTAPAQPQSGTPEQAVLAESFVLSVKSATRPGVKMDS